MSLNFHIFSEKEARKIKIEADKLQKKEDQRIAAEEVTRTIKEEKARKK